MCLSPKERSYPVTRQDELTDEQTSEELESMFKPAPDANLC